MQKIICPKCRREMRPMNPLSGYLRRVANTADCTAQQCTCGYRSVIDWGKAGGTLIHDERPSRDYAGPVTWQSVGGPA